MAVHWLQIDKENVHVLRETFAPLYEVVHQQRLRLITFNALPHSKETGNWKVKNKYGGIDAKSLRPNNRNTWHQELWLWLDNYFTSAHLEISGLHARRCFYKILQVRNKNKSLWNIYKKPRDALSAQKATNTRLVFPIHLKTSYAHYHLKSGCIVRSTIRTNQSSGMHHL